MVPHHVLLPPPSSPQDHEKGDLRRKLDLRSENISPGYDGEELRITMSIPQKKQNCSKDTMTCFMGAKDDAKPRLQKTKARTPREAEMLGLQIYWLGRQCTL